MRYWHCLAVGSATIGLLGAAVAQFTGPTPLAWRWAHPTAASPIGSPVVDGNTVYVAVGNRMFALDRETGNQKWRYPLVEGIPGYFRQGPVKIGDVVIGLGDNAIVYAVNASDGSAKWSYPCRVPTIGQPVAVGRFFVFQLSDNSIMALNAADGTAGWKDSQGKEMPPYKVFGGLNAGFGVHGDDIIYSTHDGWLICMNINTRETSWKKQFPVIYADSTPVVFGDYVYVNNGTWLSCVSASTGNPRWQQNTNEQLSFAPAVSPSGAFCISVDGKCFIFDAMSGQPRVKNVIELESIPAVRPSAVDKLFLAPTTNGALNFIDPVTGNIVWSYLVRPLAAGATTGGASGGGGANPGFGGGGLSSGGGQGNTGRGNQGRNNPNTTNPTPVLAVPASGPAVLVGKTLYVLCQDGSLLAFDPDLGVDRTGPTVNMAWPTPGSQVSSVQLELIFKIDDQATGVNGKTIKITANGQDLDYRFGRDGYAIIRFSVEGKNKPVQDGRMTINVTASDWLGNATHSTFSLTVDNTLPPLVRKTSDTGTGGAAGGGKGGGKGGLGGGGAGGG